MKVLGLLGSAVVLCATLCISCDVAGDSPSRAAPAPARPEATVVGEPRAKAPIRFPKIENNAFPPSDRKVERAIFDLRRIGLWKPLTRGLYVVVAGSRLGLHKVPEDGHLADVYLTGQVDADGSGARCDIMFYPRAMRNDLERRRSYYRLGYVADPPPSLRALWASVLAHELGHCLAGGRGEEVAAKWEDRALRRLQT